MFTFKAESRFAVENAFADTSTTTNPGKHLMHIGKQFMCCSSGILAFWMFINFAPYIIIGEYWGMVWYGINYPLATLVELYGGGIAEYTPGIIFMVSLVNGLVYASVGAALFVVAGKGYRQLYG
jgi:hypothetical protein